MVVHGDDFTALATREQCDCLVKSLKGQFEYKVYARLGSDADDDSNVRILNRIVTWTTEGVVYESDARHAEIVIKQLELQGKEVNKARGCPWS